MFNVRRVFEMLLTFCVGILRWIFPKIDSYEMPDKVQSKNDKERRRYHTQGDDIISICVTTDKIATAPNNIEIPTTPRKKQINKQNARR